MDSNMILWLFGQSIIIVLAVAGSHVATKVSIAKLQVNSDHAVERLKDLKQDHKNLALKVDGISRHVIKMDALHLQCPYVTGSKKSGQ